MTEPAFDSYPDISQSFKITGIVIPGMLLLSPVKLMLNKFIGNEASFLVYYLLAFGISFRIVFSTRKNITGNNSFNLAIENKRIIPALILGVTALNFGLISPIGSLIPEQDSIEQAFTEVASERGIFTFAAMVIAAPVLEELIFRGIILDGLLKIYTPLKSILISSFLFGLVHLNLYQLVGGFLFGIFTGWVYYRTKSLSLAIIIHAVTNFSGFLLRYFIDIELTRDASLVELYGGLTNLILATSGSITIVLICINHLKKEFVKADIRNANLLHQV